MPAACLFKCQTWWMNCLSRRYTPQHNVTPAQTPTGRIISPALCLVGHLDRRQRTAITLPTCIVQFMSRARSIGRPVGDTESRRGSESVRASSSQKVRLEFCLLATEIGVQRRRRGPVSVLFVRFARVTGFRDEGMARVPNIRVRHQRFHAKLARGGRADRRD
jgi:hypothetical protein